MAKNPMFLLGGFQGFQPQQGQAIFFCIEWQAMKNVETEQVLFRDQSDH